MLLTAIAVPRKIAARASHGDFDDVLTMQPSPVGLIVTHRKCGEEWITSITREWESAASARAHCQLCPKANCVVSERGTCNVLVGRFVDGASALLFAYPAIIVSPVSGRSDGEDATG